MKKIIRFIQNIDYDLWCVLQGIKFGVSFLLAIFLGIFVHQLFGLLVFCGILYIVIGHIIYLKLEVDEN